MRAGSLDAVSNRATFRTQRQMVDVATGEVVDLTGGTIIFEIREGGTTRALLSATNGDGVVFVDAYTYQVTFPRESMTNLCAGTYDIGLTFERDDFTTQVLIGTLPVMDGVVAA